MQNYYFRGFFQFPLICWKVVGNFCSTNAGSSKKGLFSYALCKFLILGNIWDWQVVIHMRCCKHLYYRYVNKYELIVYIGTSPCVRKFQFVPVSWKERGTRTKWKCKENFLCRNYPVILLLRSVLPLYKGYIIYNCKLKLEWTPWYKA